MLLVLACGVRRGGRVLVGLQGRALFLRSLLLQVGLVRRVAVLMRGLTRVLAQRRSLGPVLVERFLVRRAR